jgi:alanine dehydrogenase
VTSHENPSYEKFGVIHYSVPNIPGSVPRTSTLALTGATMPYILAIANMGVMHALKADDALMLGLNTFEGYLTCRGVSESLEIPYTNPAMLLI